jgi:hypothetical protein
MDMAFVAWGGEERDFWQSFGRSRQDSGVEGLTQQGSEKAVD